MLKIDVEYIKGILFIRLNGSLCNKTSCILKDINERIVLKAGIKYVLINLENLSYIDKYGINMIIDTYKNISNGKLILCGYQNNLKIKIDNSKLLNYTLSAQDEISAFKLIDI